MEMENPESVKKAVQSGLGIAFIIVYRKDKHLGHAAQAFISMARK